MHSFLPSFLRSLKPGKLGATLVLYPFLSGILHAEVKMPAVFGDHMVLQRDVPLPVWGWADPSEKITIKIQDHTVTATASADGKWSAHLPALRASSDSIQLEVTGTANSLRFNDILVGDVWLCSGQSNMEFSLSRARTAKNDLPKANHPQMRLFLVKGNSVRFTPLENCEGHWVVCTSETAKGFSAAGYYFGRQILETQKIPVGLIGSYMPGSLAQSWISVEPLLADAGMTKKYAQRYQELLHNFDAMKAAYDQWKKEVGDDYHKIEGAYWQARDKALAEGKPTPPLPLPRRDRHRHFPVCQVRFIME